MSNLAQYWKGIIAGLTSVAGIVAGYTDAWCNTWWPYAVAVLGAVGVVAKGNAPKNQTSSTE